MNKNPRTFACSPARAAAVIVLLALASSMTVAGSGPCIRADIDRPMIFPNGAFHPPGTLRLCHDREYSPVAGLHRTSVNGETAGLFLSRDTVSEEAALGPDPLVIFKQVPGAGLSLVGYAVPDKGRFRIHWLEPARRSGRTARVAPTNLDLASIPLVESGEIRLVAAKR